MAADASAVTADAGAFTRVLVVAPRTRVDVALPAEIALVEIMPMLLDMVGERSDDAGASHDGWHLLTATGTPLDPGRSLRALDILDGSALQLLPRRPVSHEPVFDDVVDAIAAAVRSRTHTADLRAVAGSLIAGAALLAAVIVLALGPHSVMASLIAALAALGALLAASAVSRSGSSPLVAVVLGVGGALAAGAAGLHVLPGASGAASLLVASTATLVYAVIAVLVIGTGAVALSAVGTVALLAAVGALSGLLWRAPASAHAVLAGAIGLAALTALPWLAVRLARLPLPIIPTTTDHLRDEALGTDFAAVGRRAAVAAEYLDGTALGAALVAAGGAALALASGQVMGILFGAVVIACLLLRVRSVPGRGQRIGLVASAAGSGLVALVLLARGTSADAHLLVAVVALTLAAVAVLGAGIGPRRRANPMAGRGLDLLESVLLVAVLPLALGAMDLYSTVRHL